MNLEAFYLAASDDEDERFEIALGHGHDLLPVSQWLSWPSEVTQWRCIRCQEVWDGLPETLLGCRGETK